jgi:16S rRNA (guanine(527)-N(7))-methyltransferase RsmG
MQPARIAELLEPYLGPPDTRRLTPDALKDISMYIDILQRWNARVNLTAIHDEEEIVTRHFGESFFAACHLFPRKEQKEEHVATAASGRPADQSEVLRATNSGGAAGVGARGRAALQGRAKEGEKTSASAPVQANDQRPTTNDAARVADVGSGAGFPGIPLKLWAPEISLTLIESNHKKATFLKEVARALTLTDIDIQIARAESLPPATYEVVTLRAVERFEVILPVASRLVAPGGRLSLLIGSAQLPSAQSALAKAVWSSPLPIPGSQSRVLAIAKKEPKQ